MAEWTSPASNSLIVIDKQIADWQSILDSLPAGSDVIFVESGGNGLEILKSELGSRTNLDAVHIFSHGQSGQVLLGTSWLDSSTLAADPALATAFASALGEDGDILLYGCDVAQGVKGESFVRELAHLTGADVAASADLTGNAALGGDWVLEYSVGGIEAQPFTSLESYQHVLPTTLAAGDMVVIGWSAITDIIRFATLVAIEAGTVIKITDKGWDTNTAAFTVSATGDGVVTWTVSSNIAAGTVLELYLGGSDATSSLTNKSLNVDLTASIALSGYTVADPMLINGDGVFIYQGLETNPFFVFGMNNSAGTVNSENWNTSVAITLRDSMLPNGTGSQNALTNGTNAIGLPGGLLQMDDVQYTGATSQTDKATWLARVSNGANWTGLNIKSDTPLNNLSITVPNSAPTATNLTQSLSQKLSTSVLALNDIVVSDANSSDTISAMLTLSNKAAGTLSTGTFGSATSTYNSGTGVWTVTGSISDVNAALAAVAFTRDSAWSQSVSITTRIRDASGTGPSDGTISISQTDDVAPTVTSIVRQTPSTLYTTATELTWRVTFSEAVENIDTSDFYVSSSSTVFQIALTKIASVGNNAYDVTMSEVGLPGTETIITNGNTDAVLNFAESQNITDAEGNALTATTPTGANESQYIADNTAPKFNGPGSSPADNGLLVNLGSDLSLQFVDSETIRGTASGIKSGKGQLTLRNLTTDEVVETFDVQSSGSLTFKNSTVTINPSKDLLSGTRYAVQIESGAITDLAGNAFAGISNNTDFNFETVPQVVLSVDNTSIKEAGGIATVTATLKDSAGNTVTAPDTVTIELSAETSTAGKNDFDLSSGTITISKGSSTGTITVTGVADEISDHGETVILGIYSVTKAVDVSEQTVSITLSENTAPVVDLNGAEGGGTSFSTSFTEDGGAVVVVKTDAGQEAFVSDSDGDTIQSMTVTLTSRPDGDSTESLALNSAATTAANGLTVNYTQSTGVLSISGTASASVYQSVLRGITYNNTSQSPDTTARSLNVVVNDGKADSAAAVSTISVTVVNDAPVLDNKASPALSGISEDLAAPASSSTSNSTLVSSLLSGVSDVDTGAEQGLAVTAVNSTQGTLWFSTDAGASWTSVDKASDSNALLLRSTDRVFWQPAANKNGTVNDAFTFRAWDQTATGVEGDYVDTSTNGGTTAYSTATDTVSVSVSAVNDAPTLTTTSKALTAVNEDTATTGTKVSALLTDLGYSDIESDVGGVAITAAEGAGEWQYSTDGSNWFDVDTVSSSASLLLNADALIRYQPDSKNGESGVQLDLRAWDQTSGTATSGSTRGTIDSNSTGGGSAFSTQLASITVDVSSVNDAPTIDNGATYTMTGIAENETSAALTVSTILSDVHLADVDSGAVSGVAITATVGNGTWEYSSDTGKTWSAISSVSDSSALLLGSDAQLRYVGDSKRGETATLSYRAWDQTSGTAGSKADASTQGGTTAFSSNSSKVSLAVSNINQRPLLDTKASPALTTIQEDSAAPQNGSTTGSTKVSTLLTGASDSDGDTPGMAIAGVNSGTVWYSIDAGTTWTAASGLSTANVLLLEGSHLIYFQPSTSKEGTIDDALTFYVWDTSGAEGAGEYWNPANGAGDTSPYSANTDTVSVSITAVNDAPTLTADDKHVLTATTEDATSTATLVSAILSGVEQADVDSGALSGMAITAVTGNGTWQFSADDGANWNNFPTVSASAALLLAADSQVRYVPDAKNSESASLSFRAWDQTTGTASTSGSAQTADTSTTGGSSVFSTQSASATLQVTAVNDAPVLDNKASPALSGISEDLAAPVTNNTSNSTLVSSLLSGVSDVDTGAEQGLAVTAVNSTQGTLWFSTDAGASWTSVDKASDSNALLLRSTDRVFWQPAANKNGTVNDAFTFRAWDQTATGVEGDYVDTSTNGGTTAYSTATDTVSVSVTAVNDAPTLTTTSKALTAVNEDTATTGTKVSALLTDLGYSDIESDVGGVAITAAEGAGEWQYSTDGSNWFDVDTVSSSASLLLNADALIRYQPDSKNGESGVQLDLRAWDQTSGTATSGSTHATADSNSTGGSTAFSTQLASITVDVSSVNDAPTIANGATYTMSGITEDETSAAVAVSTILTDAKWADIDTGAVSGIAITAASGNGGWQYSTDTGKTWSAISSVSDSSALLLASDAQLRYVGDSKRGETPSLSYRAWDQTSGSAGSKADASTHGGTTAFSGNSSNVSLTVSDINDRPVLDTKASPTLTTVLEDAAAPQSGSTTGATTVSSLLTGASDVDADTLGMAISAVSEGTLWFSLDTGKTWSAASGVSSTNALLLNGDDLVYLQPTANKNGTVSTALTFHVWDTTGAEGAGNYRDPTADSSASSPYSADTDTVSVSITAVNDAPTLTADDTHLLTGTTEDATSSATAVSAILAGVEQSDVDASALSGMAITSVTGNGTWQFSADSGANWSNFPTVSSTAALLLSADSQVRYVPDAQNSESASLSFRAWDQTSGTASAAGSIQTADTTTNGGASAFSAQSASATLQVSAVNDAPVLDTKASPALSGISEDLAAPASSSTSNSTLVSSLLSGVSDVDSSASQGLAVTAVRSTQGTLWFSIDAGSSWTPVDKASDSNALLLRATDRVYWQPAANKNGPVNDAFSFRAWDRTATGAEGEYVDTSTNGGTTAYSTATDAVAVTVTAVNDAPALGSTTKALTAVNEDTTTAGTKVSALLTDLGYSDIESEVGGVAITGAEGAGEWQYSTDGSNWFDVDTVSSSASLLLDDDALIRYQPDAKNGEANARLNLRAWDQTSGTASSGSTRGTIDSSTTGDSSAFSTQLASITVDISSVNDAPVIDSGATYTMNGITEDDTSAAVTVSTILADANWADVDISAESGIAITAVNGNGGWEYSTNTGKTWSAISGVSDSSALLLTSTTQVRYAGDKKSGETATFTYRAWDQTTGTAGSKADISTQGGTTAFSDNSANVSLVVSAVNDAPVLDTSASPILTTVLEDVAAPQNGVTLGSAQGATAVSALTGTRISDVDNATPGVAITSKAAQGNLWFSTNAGSTWTQVASVSDSNALLLRATDLVYFQGAADANGDIDVLSFRAWDTSTGGEGQYVDASKQGETTAFSTATESVTVTVTAVNDAPTLSVTNAEGSASYTENDAALKVFSGASVTTGPSNESAQTLSDLILTVGGLQDGDDELLSIDGSEVVLSDGNSITTADNKLSLSVSINSGTATVNVTGGNLTATQMQTLVNNLAYRNSSENPDETDRVFTLTSLKDSGGTANDGFDTRTLNLKTTVAVTAVNDLPTGTLTLAGTAQIGSFLKVNNTLADVDGLGTFSYIWKADDVVIDGATKDTFMIPGELINKTITATIEYTDKGGTKESITSKATASVIAQDEGGSNIDGAQVKESTQTGSNGSTIAVTEIAIVTEGREEQVGESVLANVPVVTQNGQNMLEVGLPTGTGMRVESETIGAGGDTDPNGITGLIPAIRARTNTPDALKDQQEMTGVGGGFLDDLPNKGADLIVRTLIPVVGAGITTPPANPIKISAPVPDGNTRPVATVIDVRGLPSGTVIELDNIQFVAVVGDVTMTGGAGSQVATGDSKRQIIVLGEDDDVIRAGGGDDLVGSRGGNDRLYGDEGNDLVIGGTGDDWLEGGAGNDVLQGGGSDAGTWRFSLVDGELVSRFDAAHTIAAEAATMQRTGPWWTEGNFGKETDNRLQFTYDAIDRLKLVATLYTAAVGERAEVLDFNHFVGSGLSDLQLADAAVQFWFASRIMPQAIEVQVAMLISAVWGEGAASDNLIDVGTQFITGGGSWGEAMLYLARAVEAEQLIRTDSGELNLVKDLITSETGRNQGNAGNDTLLGGAGNDRLVGGGGNNFLDGGEGIDVAVYTGALNDFRFQVKEVSGVKQMVLTTLHTGDVDVLQNIELLKVGGNYFQLDEAIAALPTGRDFSLDGYVIELTAQQVHSLDLAGLY